MARLKEGAYRGTADTSVDTDTDTDTDTPATDSAPTDSGGDDDEGRPDSSGATAPDRDRPNTESEAYRKLAESHIGRSAGDGARTATEEWVAQHSRPESNDGRSPTRTTFYAHDVDSIGPGQQHRDPEDRRSWQSLSKWQDGVQSDISRGGQNWQADKSRWFDTFGSHIEATERQEDRAEYIVQSVDISPFQGAHIPIEWVIVGALSLAIDEDATSLDTRAVERESFIGLMGDLGMDRSTLRDVRTKLREQL